MAGSELGCAPATGGRRESSSTGSTSPPAESGPKNIFSAMFKSNPQVVGWLTGLANGAAAPQLSHEDHAHQSRSSSRSASRSASRSPPDSPPTMPTGGEELPPNECGEQHQQPASAIAGSEDEALAVSRECVQRAIDAGDTSELPDVGSTPHTNSILQRSSSTLALKADEAGSAMPLELCTECRAPITGAVFMLHDRAYCCQRHRLTAYHKSERTSKQRGGSSSSVAPPFSPTGLRAQYSSWM